MIDTAQLTVLGGVASFLSAVASEGPVPSAEEIASLHLQAISVINDHSG